MDIHIPITPADLSLIDDQMEFNEKFAGRDDIDWSGSGLVLNDKGHVVVLFLSTIESLYKSFGMNSNNPKIIDDLKWRHSYKVIALYTEKDITNSSEDIKLFFPMARRELYGF